MRRALVLAVALGTLSGCGGQSAPRLPNPPRPTGAEPAATPFRPGTFACRGPGDPTEYGILRLRDDGSYSYRETVPDRRGGGGRYRVSGRHIAFASGLLRTRELYGVWQARAGGEIEFRQSSGPDAGRPIVGFGGKFGCGR